MELEITNLETDILIIGGGTAGCFAAITISENAATGSLLLKKPI